MAETIWINGVVGEINSSEVLHIANTAINVYNYTGGDCLTIYKKGPDNNFYLHKMDGKAQIGDRDSSFILSTPGTYKIIGNSKSPIYITYEII